MDIKFYTTNSEMEKVDKSLSGEVNYSCVLKEETSILNPSILLNCGSDIIQKNYAYIPEMGRYYFVKNISSVRNGLWRIDLDVDVLMTYKSQIRNLKAVVQRQENVYNLYLNDSMFKTLNYEKTVTKQFPNGFSNHLGYCLTIAG